MKKENETKLNAYNHHLNQKRNERADRFICAALTGLLQRVDSRDREEMDIIKEAYEIGSRMLAYCEYQS